MNCQHAQNSLSAYLDRELSGDQMMAIRSHVLYCPECRDELENLRTVKSSLASLPIVEPREGFADEVLRMVLKDGPAASPSRIPFALVLATSVAAAVFAVIAFNAFFGTRSQPQFANEATRFDAASDKAVTSPDFGGHAPLIPVGR